MASTIPLSRTIGIAQNFNRNAPLTFTGSNEPAFSNADWVRQFMLAPPFAWSWNRVKANITCVTGTQDYSVSAPSFGWIEKAIVVNPESGDEAHELEVVLVLGKETVPNMPTKIAAQTEDGSGNITFRLMPPPDVAYTVEIVYQKAAPLFVSTGDMWSPIPDRFSFLYNQGMLAKSYEYLDDNRFGIAMQLFLRQVIAANAGLEDTEIDLFLLNRNIADRQIQGAVATGQMGRQSRGMF